MNARPHYHRNFAVLLAEFVTFTLGMTFASTTIVLPQLVGELTDSTVAVGLVITVSSGAWLIPQLLFAKLLINKRRKKPYLLLGVGIGGPPYLLYALALLLGVDRAPLLALLLLYVVQIIVYGSDALAGVAGFDVIGKVIPNNRLGRLFGSGQFISALLALGAGWIIATLLGAGGPAFPVNYAVILGLAGFCLVLGLFSLVFLIEPDEPVEESRTSWRDYLPQLSATLRQDRTFARLITVRLLSGFNGLALSFYILFAARELGLPAVTIGLFIAAQTLGRIVASVGMGALAERVGSERVIQVATAIGVTAPVLCLALLLTEPREAVTVAVLAWVFVTIGITLDSEKLGYQTYALELAPSGRRPTYVGLFNTIKGVLILLPAIGGLLLATTSYGVLFAITAVMMVAALALSWSLPSLRRTAPEARVEPIA